jgi:DNA/RNA endonuclease YhcR with UshA esterase domain
MKIECGYCIRSLAAGGRGSTLESKAAIELIRSTWRWFFFCLITALDGKSVEAMGKIKDYHDRPEIILDSTNQFKVIRN